jgi:Flp pilus assembly protein TadG
LPTIRPRAGEGQRGQTLVEFALIFPLFWTLVLGIIDFGFAFNAILSVDFASRHASLLASEAGDLASADCVILQGLDAQFMSPADPTRIVTVDIFQADHNGAQIGSARSTYTRGGSTTCTYPDGTSVTVPYGRTANGYPPTSRCNWLAGCGTGHPELDTIGVRVTYAHHWVTPLHAFLGGGSVLSVERSNAMRMEPVL